MTAHLTVTDVLNHKGRDTYSLPPDALVYDAIKKMAENGIGSMLVKTGDRLVGIFTDRDYSRKIILQGRYSKATALAEVMSTPVRFITPDCTVDEAMSIMTEHRIRHLPVMEGEQVAGLVSIGDLVRSILSEQAREIQHLHAYITGQYPG